MRLAPVVALLLVACNSSHGRAGAPCAPGGEACGEGLVCIQREDGEHECMIPCIDQACIDGFDCLCADGSDCRIELLAGSETEGVQVCFTGGTRAVGEPCGVDAACLPGLQCHRHSTVAAPGFVCEQSCWQGLPDVPDRRCSSGVECSRIGALPISGDGLRLPGQCGAPCGPENPCVPGATCSRGVCG